MRNPDPIDGMALSAFATVASRKRTDKAPHVTRTEELRARNWRICTVITGLTENGMPVRDDDKTSAVLAASFVATEAANAKTTDDISAVNVYRLHLTQLRQPGLLRAVWLALRKRNRP